MTNIILCGGNGTRLWPISRTLMPKQFVKLFSKKSLFQLTVERNSKLCSSQLIVSNTEQYFLALDQLEELNKQNNKYLLEPIAKNTAPAIALACLSLDENEIVLVTPSDHLIKNEDEYKKVVEIAKEFASEDKLVTFGITPTSPETGFGYIEAEASTLGVKCEALSVKKFHEKPDLKTAQQYLKINQTPSTEHLALNTYLWNSGMFCFKVGVFLNELKKYSPEIYNQSIKAFNNASKNEIIRIKYEDMANIPENSIDYAVMEKSNIVKVIPSNISWSDVGSFDSLIQECDVINTNSYEESYENNFYYSDNEKKVIATIGLKDFIVVDTNDALLITKKGETQKVKNIVEKIKHSTFNSTLNTHLTGNRPWGTYTVLEESNGYKIKRIEVKPNKRLSLQKHQYRNEHWVVVSGVATVEVDNKKFLLNENESTYIKAGQIHRLSNDTNKPLVIIEVQVGSYTEEDDIIRFEDDFKRE
ncbi:mannose-1-phosphate guanylyltransferase/mannose-6-phosphate isomerase [Aliarcobacter lanthieri]|uniref:mannose-1-phosphate guanylyltransferase/mannose-6-phosphate isomerase n=1 Tax=Aliarcobacter lanthieri TaxID=1355374 RepID=UPI003AAE1138